MLPDKISGTLRSFPLLTNRCIEQGAPALEALMAFAGEAARLDEIPYIHLLTLPDDPRPRAASAEPACAVGADVRKAVRPAVNPVLSA